MQFKRAMGPQPVPKEMPNDIHHPLQRQQPLIYLVTSGQTTPQTTPATEDFSRLLRLIKAAVSAQIDLLQIREKNLSARVLYALTASAADITRGSHTKLLVNDRADIAAAAGAAGVHLATDSLRPNVVRHAFGDDFLIGVSAHSVAEAVSARAGGADFAVFGPVFATPAKEKFGEPQGLKQLETVAGELAPFPVLALGGLTVDRVSDCLRAGARGVAAIRMLSDPIQLEWVVNEIRDSFERRLG